MFKEFFISLNKLKKMSILECFEFLQKIIRTLNKHEEKTSCFEKINVLLLLTALNIYEEFGKVVHKMSKIKAFLLLAYFSYLKIFAIFYFYMFFKKIN